MSLYTDLSDLVPEVALEVIGCPQPVVEYHLLRVARQFCQVTDAWQDTFPTISYEEGERTYFIVTADSGGELVRLVRMTMGDELQWDRREQDDPLPFPPGSPPFTVDAALEQITLSEDPTGDLVFVGSMCPKLTATRLPTVLRDRHMEALRAGTLARLMSMGNKPWTDRELSAKYGYDFDLAKSAAAVKAAIGNTRAPLRTRKWG